MGKSTSAERDRLGDLTRRVFEKRAGRRLGDEDAREIGENLVGFFRVLAEWASAEPKPSLTLGGEVAEDLARQRSKAHRRAEERCAEEGL